jgi:hypothetical protein
MLPKGKISIFTQSSFIINVRCLSIFLIRKNAEIGKIRPGFWREECGKREY